MTRTIDLSVTPQESVGMATDIVAAYISNHAVKAGDLPELLSDVHTAVQGLINGASYGVRTKPAVPINKSVTPSAIICLEDGKKLKMLKRYLRTHYNLSPQEYRRKWGLPADYPMVAPNYSKRRAQFAKDIGLGTPANKSSARRKTAKRKTTKRGR